MAADPSVELSIRNWFQEMQTCVQAVDFDRAEKIFAADTAAFGTFAGVMHSRQQLRADQWSNVWPKIKDFVFHLDQLVWGGTGELAWAACPWGSTGFRSDGTPFDRPGRVTVVFERRGGVWLAVHTHFSLYPTSKVSDTQS